MNYEDAIKFIMKYKICEILLKLIENFENNTILINEISETLLISTNNFKSTFTVFVLENIRKIGRNFSKNNRIYYYKIWNSCCFKF